MAVMSGVASAQTYGRYQTCSLQTALGQAVAGAEVYFLTQPANVQTLSPQASVYSSATGGAVSQPVLTNGFGECSAYLTPGIYTVVYVSPLTGTISYPDQNIAVGGGTPGSVTFDEIGSGTNTIATMQVGSGASVAPTGSGRIKATDIDGVQVTGTPGTGQVITATSPTAATWQTPGGSSSTTLTGDVTGTGTGTVATTLATVNSTPGTYVVGSTVLVVNGKGLLTGIGPPFTANLACTSNITCGALEAGVTTTNPAGFTASYTNPTVPTSASLSDGINSPVSCTSSFTACSLPHSYCTVGQGLTTITFTLTAVGSGQTLTPSQSTTCTYRTFAGAGTAGATGATASGTSAALVGATGTLASGGLGNQGSYSCTASSQKCYVIMQGGSHTFTSGGFSFPMLTPTSLTFTDQDGVVISGYFIYESANTLTGTFPLVAS
jgi:hypothetical protein